VSLRQFIRRVLIAVLNRSPLVRNVAADLKPHVQLELAPESNRYHLLAIGEDPQFVTPNCEVV
jgi:hypothetical protein